MQEMQVRSLGWDDPWVGTIPWKRRWQPTPVFLPRKSHAQRAWGIIVHGVTNEWSPTQRLNNGNNALLHGHWFRVSAKGFLSSRELTEELKDKQHLARRKAGMGRCCTELVWPDVDHRGTYSGKWQGGCSGPGYKGLSWQTGTSAWLCPKGCGGSY